MHKSDKYIPVRTCSASTYFSNGVICIWNDVCSPHFRRTNQERVIPTNSGDIVDGI